MDCNVIYWFNSSQLIRVDKFLIIKDTNVTLFGKSRLNENSVEAFFRCNAFSTHRKCIEEHFQCVLKHCQCVSTIAKCVANPFKKHFQNFVNALANTDNAFNKTAGGCLESFTEPLVISLCNTKKLIENTQLVYTAPYTYTRPMPTRPPGSRAGDIPDVHTNTTFSFFLRLQTYYLSTTISVTNVL